jgi:hypothetical protein
MLRYGDKGQSFSKSLSRRPFIISWITSSRPTSDRECNPPSHKRFNYIVTMPNFPASVVGGQGQASIWPFHERFFFFRGGGGEQIEARELSMQYISLYLLIRKEIYFSRHPPFFLALTAPAVRSYEGAT